MNELFWLVMLIGGGLWVYRQWKEVQKSSGGGTAIVQRPVVASGQWEVLNPSDAVIEEAARQIPTPPAPGKPGGMNKWVVLALCVIWILSPLDGDFIPFLGWIDDVFAAYIAYRQFKT
jgi:Protein of unknown function (DUF1232)